MASESGPYAVCKVFGESEFGNFETLTWGFDTWGEAYRAVSRIADEQGVKRDELVVIKCVTVCDLDDGIDFRWDEDAT